MGCAASVTTQVNTGSASSAAGDSISKLSVSVLGQQEAGGQSNGRADGVGKAPQRNSRQSIDNPHHDPGPHGSTHSTAVTNNMSPTDPRLVTVSARPTVTDARNDATQRTVTGAGAPSRVPSSRVGPTAVRDAWAKEDDDEPLVLEPFFWSTDPSYFEAHYELLTFVGKGQFGSVHTCRHRRSGLIAAVKKLDKARTKRSVFESEVEAMRLCRGHPGVVSLYGVVESPTVASLVMEYLQGGELFDRLVEAGAYSEKEAREPIRCAVAAVAHLHSLGIVHRDLKPENLLLVSKEAGDGRLKVADFGLSKILPPGAPKLTPVCGTWAYSAPEMRAPPDPATGKRPGYDFAVDVWALGIIMYIVLCGFHPFDTSGEASQGEILEAIQAGRYDFSDPCWAGISDQAKDLIRGMLTVDSTKRLTATQALNHPWMRNAYLSAQPLSPNIGYAIDGYRKRMNAKMKATALVALASVHMLQRSTGRRWSAPSVPLSNAVPTAADFPMQAIPLAAVRQARAGGAGGDSKTGTPAVDWSAGATPVPVPGTVGAGAAEAGAGPFTNHLQPGSLAAAAAAAVRAEEQEDGGQSQSQATGRVVKAREHATVAMSTGPLAVSSGSGSTTGGGSHILEVQQGTGTSASTATGKLSLGTGRLSPRAQGTGLGSMLTKPLPSFYVPRTGSNGLTRVSSVEHIGPGGPSGSMSGYPGHSGAPSASPPMLGSSGAGRASSVRTITMIGSQPGGGRQSSQRGLPVTFSGLGFVHIGTPETSPTAAGPSASGGAGGIEGRSSGVHQGGSGLYTTNPMLPLQQATPLLDAGAWLGSVVSVTTEVPLAPIGRHVGMPGQGGAGAAGQGSRNSPSKPGALPGGASAESDGLPRAVKHAVTATSGPLQLQPAALASAIRGRLKDLQYAHEARQHQAQQAQQALAMSARRSASPPLAPMSERDGATTGAAGAGGLSSQPGSLIFGHIPGGAGGVGPAAGSSTGRKSHTRKHSSGGPGSALGLVRRHSLGDGSLAGAAAALALAAAGTMAPADQVGLAGLPAGSPMISRSGSVSGRHGLGATSSFYLVPGLGHLGLASTGGGGHGSGMYLGYHASGPSGTRAPQGSVEFGAGFGHTLGPSTSLGLGLGQGGPMSPLGLGPLGSPIKAPRSVHHTREDGEGTAAHGGHSGHGQDDHGHGEAEVDGGIGKSRALFGAGEDGHGHGQGHVPSLPGALGSVGSSGLDTSLTGAAGFRAHGHGDGAHSLGAGGHSGHIAATAQGQGQGQGRFTASLHGAGLGDGDGPRALTTTGKGGHVVGSSSGAHGNAAGTTTAQGQAHSLGQPPPSSSPEPSEPVSGPSSVLFGSAHGTSVAGTSIAGGGGSQILSATAIRLNEIALGSEGLLSGEVGQGLPERGTVPKAVAGGQPHGGHAHGPGHGAGVLHGSSEATPQSDDNEVQAPVDNLPGSPEQA